MLTIHPNLVNSYSKTPAFGRHIDNLDGEYVDYDEVFDDENLDLPSEEDSFEMSEQDGADFNIVQEKAEAKKELDLWNQAKQNIDSIAKTTESVPVINKSTKILSGLISVAIGWGGLRWGSAGTLEVASKLGKTRLVSAIKGYSSAGAEAVSGSFTKAKKYLTGRNWYKSVEATIDGWKLSFLDTGLGRTLSGWKTAVTTNPLYTGVVGAKNNAVTYVKSLNPKRVFVETMGVAGGGTAAVEMLGGKSVDGAKQNVEVDEKGNYLVNGKVAIEAKGDYSDVA